MYLLEKHVFSQSLFSIMDKLTAFCSRIDPRVFLTSLVANAMSPLNCFFFLLFCHSLSFRYDTCSSSAYSSAVKEALPCCKFIAFFLLCFAIPWSRRCPGPLVGPEIIAPIFLDSVERLTLSVERP